MKRFEVKLRSGEGGLHYTYAQDLMRARQFYDERVWEITEIDPDAPLTFRRAEPVPIATSCPTCGTQHIDEGEWATRPHKTHQCQKCGAQWRPHDFPTVGILPVRPASAGGTVKWKGGECPVDPDVQVRITFRNGLKTVDVARRLRWDWTGSAGDIVSYREAGIPAASPEDMKVYEAIADNYRESASLAAPRAPGYVVTMKQYDELRNAAKALLDALQRNEPTLDAENALERLL